MEKLFQKTLHLEGSRCRWTGGGVRQMVRQHVAEAADGCDSWSIVLCARSGSATCRVTCISVDVLRLELADLGYANMEVVRRRLRSWLDVVVCGVMQVCSFDAVWKLRV